MNKYFNAYFFTAFVIFSGYGRAFADVEQHNYQVDRKNQLQYLVAAPSFEDGAKYPLWIFQPGDGNVADTFQPEQYEAMMDGFAKTYNIALVMPQLRRQLDVSDPKKYCELDFFERIGDLSKLIDSAKKLPFVNTSKIILWGYSAGGDIATLTAMKRHDLWGVVTYGTGVVSAIEIGKNPPISLNLLNNRCSGPANYLNRSGNFWRQLFEQTLEYADIRAVSIPYLALFGEADPVTPFDDDQSLYAEKLTALKPNFSFESFPGLDHTGYFNPSVFQRMMSWTQ